MKVPFFIPYWKKEELATVQAESGKDSDAVERLECEFPQAMQREGTAIAVGSGRTALLLALRVLKQQLPDRNEVVIPSYTCRGVLEPIIRCGLTPVFADIGEDLNITFSRVSPLVNEKTLAVIVVHTGGKYVADASRLTKLAQQYGAAVIDDFCQAPGIHQQTGGTGSVSPIAIFSFGLGKCLTATAGGMLLARDPGESFAKERANLREGNPSHADQRLAYIRKTFTRNAERLSFYPPKLPTCIFASAYGYEHMQALDAVLIRHQLERRKEMFERRQEIAARRIESMRSLPGIEIPQAAGPSVWSQFTLLAETPEWKKRLRAGLFKAGIQTEEAYPPLHLCDFGESYTTPSLPNCEKVSRRAFHLPIYPGLTDEEIEWITSSMRKIVAGSS